jgi:hypothetical protein
VRSITMKPQLLALFCISGICLVTISIFYLLYTQQLFLSPNTHGMSIAQADGTLFSDQSDWSTLPELRSPNGPQSTADDHALRRSSRLEKRGGIFDRVMGETQRRLGEVDPYGQMQLEWFEGCMAAQVRAPILLILSQQVIESSFPDHLIMRM